jgi:hypothetical protein
MLSSDVLGRISGQPRYEVGNRDHASLFEAFVTAKP